MEKVWIGLFILQSAFAVMAMVGWAKWYVDYKSLDENYKMLHTRFDILNDVCDDLNEENEILRTKLRYPGWEPDEEG